MTEAQELADWNRQQVALSQSLLGAISENFRLVWLRHEEGRWELGFILERDMLRDREEIEEVVTQFEALQDRGIDCSVKIVVKDGQLDWPEPPTRVVFRRRED